MAPNNTFQKFFFAFIFIITALVMIKMWQDHKVNLRKGECVTRTRGILAQLSDETLPHGVNFAPADSATTLRAIELARQLGDSALFCNFKESSGDSSTMNSIAVIRRPAGDDPARLPTYAEAFQARWTRGAPEEAWNLTITIATLAVDSLVF